MSWRYLAQDAVTREWIHWDLPLEIEGVEWALSAPGSLRASIAPRVDGLEDAAGELLLREWSTMIYAEHGDELRWAGIVTRCAWDGDKWSLEASGVSTYPHSRIYRGEYIRTQVDPRDVIVHIWEHIQSDPAGDLGVRVVADPTGVRLGELAYAVDENGVRLEYAIPHKQWGELFALGWVGGVVQKIHVSNELWSWLLTVGFTRVSDGVVTPPASWSEAFPWWEAELLNLGWVGGGVVRNDVSAKLWMYLVGHGWAAKETKDGDTVIPANPYVVYPPTMNEAMLQNDDKVIEAAPYQLLWWETPNCGKEIADLTQQAPFDYMERVSWDADHLEPIHEVVFAHPRLGRRRDDIAFEHGINVTNIGTVTSSGDDYANSVIGLGAGEGRTVLLRQTVRNDGRLRRDHVYSDKAIGDSARMDSLIAREAALRSGDLRVDSIDVIDHPHAPIGSWQVGDDILLRAGSEWLGDIDLRLRVTAWSLTGEHTATLRVARSDSHRYGG